MNSTVFCTIENEPKAFDIVKIYYNSTISLDEIEKYKAIQKIDNDLQKIEIEIHLQVNRVSDNDKSQSTLDWIKNYGKSFRIFLNTLKIALILLEYNQLDPNELSFEDFCKLKEKINSQRAFLDFIHG
jgi:hypothetical protein